MRSRFFSWSGHRVRPISQFIATRPWLCGAGALAVLTAGLFAWFCAQRWDDVDVSAAPQANQVVDRVRLVQGDPRQVSFEHGSVTELSSDHGNETAGTQPVGWSDLPRTAERTAERMPVRQVSATAADQPSASFGAPGAWLIGTIEEIEDDGFRHARSGRGWPGLASHPGTSPW